MSGATTTAYSRVWTLQYRARPNTVPVYQNMAKAGGIDGSLGDITPIRVPSSEQYGKFEEVGIIRGAEDRPTLGLTFRFKDSRSDIEKLAKLGCAVDVQIHFGKCKNPTLFNGGWEKIIVFENAYFSSHSLGDLGALDSGEDALIDETVELSGEWYYEVVPIRFSERAQAEVGQEIISIDVCDGPSCGSCDVPSDGCQRVFAVSAAAVASPGVKVEVLFSPDGGSTWGDTWVDTMNIGEDANDAACVGSNYVIISEDTESIHYAPTIDIQNGTETWSEVATGFVTTKGPLCITEVNGVVYIGAEGGYVYYSENVVDGVEVVEAGNATTNNVLSIHALDSEHALAGTAAGFVLYTLDGTTWTAATKPDAVNLPSITAVFMHDEKVWMVGTADNALWYTIDQGVTWTQKRFPNDSGGGGGTGTIWDIMFATDAIGYMSVQNSSTAGKIYRTLDGGNSWYILPEGAGSIPANDKINKLATCFKEANVVFGGGLADNGADGFIVKGS